MHILLVNDDGIHAPGIRTMCEVAAQAGHRVSVCAPDRERSGASQAITLLDALHAAPMDVPGATQAWAVDGTPADCSRLGLYLLRDEAIDLVITGINRGMNQGGACVYSGTVSSARQAAMSGVPALAVSLCTDPRNENDDYVPAARVAMRVIDWMQDHPLPRGVIYNLNVPVLPYEQIRGIVPALLSPTFLDAALYHEERDEKGSHFYYRTSEFPPLDNPDYDAVRTDQGYASITKLTWDLRMNADDSELAEITL